MIPEKEFRRRVELAFLRQILAFGLLFGLAVHAVGLLF